MTSVGNLVRMLVRPAVTIMLAGVMCKLALDGDRDMVLGVSTLAGVAVNSWFADRSNKPAKPGDK